MKPRYSAIVADMNLLLSGCIKKPSFWSKYIVSTTVRRHSSKLWSIVILSLMYIANVYHCILSFPNGGFVSFVNFCEPGHKPLGRKTNFKNFELQRNLRKLVSSPSILLSSRHLSSQYLLKLSEVLIFQIVI